MCNMIPKFSVGKSELMETSKLVKPATGVADGQQVPRTIDLSDLSDLSCLLKTVLLSIGQLPRVLKLRSIVYEIQ
jgi:hypothetical protein